MSAESRPPGQSLMLRVQKRASEGGMHWSLEGREEKRGIYLRLSMNAPGGVVFFERGARGGVAVQGEVDCEVRPASPHSLVG